MVLKGGVNIMNTKIKNSRYIVTKGPLMTVRTSVVTTLLLSVSLFASTDSENDRYGKIQSRLNSIMNKAGIHFSGTFRSQYLQSMLDADNSGDSAVDWTKKTTESNEYTSVDFDIGARPNDALSARCMFRMHQNWQNFFSDVANPIFTRWISIDGNVKDMFRFNVGDHKQKYSKLTLWSPDIAIPFEPEIFAAKRREAMKEVFLGNNERFLTGVNFNFDAELVPVFNEMHINVNLSRLRLNGTSWGNGNAVADRFEDADMDRYFTGINADFLALRGLGFGGTFMTIFDLVPTLNGNEKKLAEARIDPATRFGQIFGGRLNPSTDIFLDSDVFSIGINFEAMTSKNRDSAWYDIAPSTADPSTMDSTFNSREAKGMAMDIGINGTINFGEGGKVEFDVGFMNNDRNYINEMAQSPSFLGQRIMNNENDFSSANYAGLYTTYDAMYDYVFKFTPSSNNDWTKEPHRKISYINAILTPDEIEKALSDAAAADSGAFICMDPTLQLVLPYGPATPNRTGPKGDLDVKFFDGGIDAGLSFAKLSEVESEVMSFVDTLGIPQTITLAKTEYLHFGGGLSIDIATWAKALNSFKLSVGYLMNNAENPGLPVNNIPLYKSSNNMLNLGFYYNFYKRFSLLAGYQTIKNKSETGASNIAGIVVPAIQETVTQKHWAVGLEYKVTPTSMLTGRIGKIGADFTSDNTVMAELLKSGNFSIWQSELFLTVDF